MSASVPSLSMSSTGCGTDEPVCVSCNPQGVRDHRADWNAIGRVGSRVTSDAGSSGHKRGVDNDLITGSRMYLTSDTTAAGSQSGGLKISHVLDGSDSVSLS